MSTRLMEAPTSADGALIDRYRPPLLQALKHFANDANAPHFIATAFGEVQWPARVINILVAWREANFAGLPDCRLIPVDVLHGRHGAYAASEHTIFLAREWLANPATTTADVLRVLLEEVGHGLDATINDRETPGDEGAIFAALIMGDPLDAATLAALRAKDDHGWIIVEGRLLQVEFSGSITVVQFEQLRAGLGTVLSDMEAALDATILNQNLPLFGDDLHDAFQGNTDALHKIMNFRQFALNAIGSTGQLGAPDSNGNYTLQQVADALNNGLANSGAIPSGTTPVTVTPANELNISTALLGCTYTNPRGR